MRRTVQRTVSIVSGSFAAALFTATCVAAVGSDTYGWVVMPCTVVIIAAGVCIATAMAPDLRALGAAVWTAQRDDRPPERAQLRRIR